MASYLGPRISTYGLDLEVDAADINSYPRSGTIWYDLTQNNKNGTIVSGPSGPTFSSEVGGCFNFTGGLNSYISFSNTSSFVFTTGTMSMWLCTDSPNSSQTPLFIAGGSTNRYYVQFLFPSNVRFVRGTDSSKVINLSTSVTSGTWQHIAMTYTSNGASTTGNFSGFLNGNYVGTNAYAEGTSFGSTIYLGSQPGVAAVLDGRIAVFNFYPRVLSNDEIKQNFLNLSGRFFGV